MLSIASNHLGYFLQDFTLYLIILPISVALFIFSVFKIYKSNISQKSKLIFISTAFTALTIITFFTAFEAYFRYVYDEPDGLGYLRVNQRWVNRHVIYNNYFFRDRNFDPQKKEGITRIAVLGDSNTFGAGVKNADDRFSNLLEKKLKASGKNVEVYNLGIPGTDTESHIERYHNTKDLKFDVIVWQYFLNDIQPKGKSTGNDIIVNNSKTNNLMHFISKHSFFLDYMYWRIKATHGKTAQQLREADLKQFKNPEVLENHKKNINNLIDEIRSNNQKLVVIIIPMINLLDNYPAKDVHELVGNIFKDKGVDVIDLLNDLNGKNPKEYKASKFDHHPNEKVHEIAAQKLYEKLLPILGN